MTIKFPDYSHYQAGHSLAGAPALIAKGTEGTGFVDSAYRDFKTRAAAAGIPFMGYHWINTTDIAAQAAHAYSVMPDVPVMWDAEATGVTVPRLLDITKRFRALNGNPHSIYLPHWFWSGHMGSPDLRPLEAAGLYLISSNYPLGGYTEDGRGWLPYGGVTPKQWQYTSTPVDMNAFKGTVDDLRRLWGLSEEDDMSVAEVRQAILELYGEAANPPAGEAGKDGRNLRNRLRALALADDGFTTNTGATLAAPALDARLTKLEQGQVAILAAIAKLGAGAGDHTHDLGPAKPTDG